MFNVEYFIEAQHEARGEGSGWDIAPNDETATCFVVVARFGPDDYRNIDAADTRKGAEAIIRGLTRVVG